MQQETVIQTSIRRVVNKILENEFYLTNISFDSEASQNGVRTNVAFLAALKLRVAPAWVAQYLVEQLKKVYTDGGLVREIAIVDGAFINFSLGPNGKMLTNVCL